MKKRLNKSGRYSVMSNLPQKFNDDDHISFLLEEFQQLAESWRHTDRRIDSTINYYITILSLLVPATILFYKELTNTNLVYIYGISVSSTLIIFGHLVWNRITATDIRKSEYILGMQMIRAYFVNQKNDIANYLIFPIAKPAITQFDKFRQLKPYFHRNLVIPIIIVNSLLAGGLFSMIWGLLRIEFRTTFNTVLIGIIIFLFALIYQFHAYRKKLKIFIKVHKNLEDIYT